MSGSWLLLGELLPLAMVIALSPLSIVPAVLLVLHSAHPRSTGLAFLVGWLTGLAALTLIAVEVPRLLGFLHRSPPTWTYWVGVVLGVALIVAGLWRWLTRANAAESSRGGWAGWIEAATPSGTALLGLVLPVLNVKVLLMCAGAGLLIGTADLSTGESWTVVAFFTVAAGSTVAAPILAYAMLAERLDVPIHRLRSWMQRNHAGLTAFTLMILGVILVYAGCRGLV